MINKIYELKQEIRKKGEGYEADIIGMNEYTYNELKIAYGDSARWYHSTRLNPEMIVGLKIRIRPWYTNYQFEVMDSEKGVSVRGKVDNILTIDRDKYFTFGVDWGKPEVKLPNKYIINKGATVLFWDDGSKTVVKRHNEDAYDIAKGFLWAYFQKTSGMSRTKANKYLAKIVEETLENNKES